MPSADIRHFHCDLGDGVVCSLTFNVSQYSRTKGMIDPAPKVVWRGWRTAEMFPRYMLWIHATNIIISQAIKGRHAYTIQDWSSKPPHWEVWIYEPDGRKNCIQKGEGVFDRSWIKR